MVNYHCCGESWTGSNVETFDFLTRLLVSAVYLTCLHAVISYRRIAPTYLRPSLSFLAAAVAGWVAFYVWLIFDPPIAAAAPFSRALHLPLATAITLVVSIRRWTHRQ